MAKPTAAWGIDIGQCALKALRLEIVDGQPTATAFDYIEHPKILSQPDADPDQLTREALEKFLSRNQLGSDLVAIGVPGQSGLARFVKLPPVEPTKIPDIVRFEAKQQIPFPLDEVVWDFQTISGGEVVNNFAMETEIGLFAMKKEVIAKHMGQFNQANIEVHVVQMAPLALCNYATYELLGKGGPTPVEVPTSEETPRGKKRCVVVLDVGTESSNLIITDAGKIIWQRPLPLGGNHFTKALTKEMKLTFAKAEHLKRNAAKSPDLATILKSLRPVLTDFVGEVQRSLGYFTNTHRDAHVASLVGLGSAFRLPGLQKYMSEKLSLEVKRPNSVDRLQGDAVKSDPVFIDNLLTFPVAYGLALQGLNELGERKDYGRINTNLLPSQIKIDRVIRAKKPYAAAAAAALLLGTGGLALGFGAQYSATKDKTLDTSIKNTEGAITLARAQGTQKSEGEKDIAKTQADVKAIIKGNDSRLDMVRLNKVMMAMLPQAGPAGNLNDDRRRYWDADEGPRAVELYKDRIKRGVTFENMNNDDKSEFLAQVQIESVFMQYAPDLKAFMKGADLWVKEKYGVDIAANMPESEKENSTEGPPRVVPKAPEGGGYIVQVSGFTNHDSGKTFLNDALVRNFRNANTFADQTLYVFPKDEKGNVFNEVNKFLPGVADPAKGRISHAFLLLTVQVDNPQPKVFEHIDKNYVTELIGTAAAPAPGAEGQPVLPASPGAYGWRPLDAAPAATSGGMGRGAPPPPTPSPATPATPTTPAPTAKKKYRYEFVLCFIYRDAVAVAPGAPGAPGTPGAAAPNAAAPTPAPAPAGAGNQPAPKSN